TLLPSAKSNGYLDPENSFTDGAHALAGILGQRGVSVTAAYSTASALAAVGAGATPATLVITSPRLLTKGQLAGLGRARADLLLVGPGPGVLAALAPAIRVRDRFAGPDGKLLRPGCALRAAILAGTANVGGSSYRTPLGAVRCYLVNGFPTMVRIRAAGRMVTILGSGAP